MACPFAGLVSKGSKCPVSGVSSGAPAAHAEDGPAGYDEEDEPQSCCPVMKTGGLTLFAAVEGQEKDIDMKNVPTFLAVEDLVQLLMTSNAVTAIPKDTPLHEITVTKDGAPQPYPANAKLANLGLEHGTRLIVRHKQPDVSVRLALPGEEDLCEMGPVPSEIDVHSFKQIIMSNPSIPLPDKTRAADFFLVTEENKVLFPPEAKLCSFNLRNGTVLSVRFHAKKGGKATGEAAEAAAAAAASNGNGKAASEAGAKAQSACPYHRVRDAFLDPSSWAVAVPFAVLLAALYYSSFGASVITAEL
eukprot:tig00020515_g9772.t1